MASVNCPWRAGCLSQHYLLLQLEDHVTRELGFINDEPHGGYGAWCQFCLCNCPELMKKGFSCGSDKGKIT